MKDVDLATFGGETAEPSGLQAEIYLATTVELFWDRTLAPGLVYEIIRDGKVVSETADVSYFDDTLSPGQTFQYEIIAINLARKRSAAVTVSVKTDSNTDAINCDKNRF